MRIAIDLRPLMSGKISGVETYILHLLEALFKLDRKNHYILWYNAFKPIDTSRFPLHYPNVTLKFTRIPNTLLNLFLSLLRWPKIDRLMGEKIDLLWVPDPRPAPVSPGVKKVITFHDLSFEEFKYAFTLRARLWHKILRPRKEAQEADHLIAVSAFTKKHLKELYAIPGQRVTVIHEAAAQHLMPHAVPKLFEVIQRKYSLPNHYILLLSTIEPRKNIAGAIEAFCEWQEETKANLHLVIAGEIHQSIFRRVKTDSSHPRLHFPGFIAEEDKAVLYQNALCLLYPSFYEGFGLPILEAMQCGTPVITSDGSGMAEVAGDAALLINPNNIKEIKSALHDLYSDKRLREELREKGLQRAQKFSWKKAAAETLKVLTMYK